MVLNGHLVNIKVTLERIPTIYDTYVLLFNLIERYPKEALSYGYFELLVRLSVGLVLKNCIKC